MNLASQLAELSEVQKGPPCRLRVWLDTLSPEQLKEVEEAFQDHRVLHRVLSEWITAQPGAFKATASNISHHRSGTCAGCNRAGYKLTRA